MAKKNKTHYLGNPNIKASGVAQNLTPHEMEELIKCKNDPMYFITNYIRIRNTDNGRILFDPFPFQRDIINMIVEERFSLINCARQIGKSTTILALAIWYVLFNEEFHCYILANNGATAKELFYTLQTLYEELPFFIQQGVRSYNKSEFILENRSTIKCVNTTPSSIRGRAVNMVIIDEAAFIEDFIWKPFWKSTLPVISSGQTTKMVLISTPNSMNHFYDLVIKARKKKPGAFSLIEVPWSARPDRDEKWKFEEIERSSVEDFSQEHELNFLGSTGSLVSSEAIKKIETRAANRELMDHKFKIYREPLFEAKYAIVVDPSGGMGLDYSVISVIDISRPVFEQVAIYRNNEISHTQLPDVIYQIANFYNQGVVIIENNVFDYIAETLNDGLDYPNMYNPDEIAEQGGSYKAGVRQTVKTKRIGCNNFKTLIENGKFIIHDFETVREISNFSKNKKGTSYEASTGNDDIVMTLVIFSWAIKQNNFMEMTGLDVIAEIDAESKQELFSEDNDDFYSMPTGLTSVRYDEVDGLGL